MRSIVSLFKITVFIILSLITIPVQFLSGKIFNNSKKFFFIPKIYNSIVCSIYKIKIQTNGTPELNRQVIFVGNHLSYIDIPVLGATLPATFISKSDVKKWPIFGFLAMTIETVFIERKREAAARCIKDIKRTLLKKRSLILFPEGTSTQGITVLPFKSTIFNLFLDKDLKENLIIQPFTLSIQKINGHPVKTIKDNDLYAWHGDITMVPHLWALGKSNGVEILITFHAPRYAKDYEDRKVFARDCYNDSLNGLQNSLPPTLDLKSKAS